MKTIKVPSNWGNPLIVEINSGKKVILKAGETVYVSEEIAEAIENALANLPKENKDIPLPEEIKNIQPMLITFNNSDFENTDSGQSSAAINYVLNNSKIILFATFDVSRLNFTVPEGADVTIHKVLIEGEPFDLSLLDKAIKEMDFFKADYGEGWFIEGDVYSYIHEYSFGTADNANTVFAEMSEMGLNGFQLLVNNYNQITAKEV